MRKEKETQYEVTIRCMTYQHAAYVLDALHSFVMQETSFPFLILIVDDASTDGTARIIRDFIKEGFDVDDSTVSWNSQDEYSDNLYAQHKSNKNCFIISMNLNQNLYRDQAKKRSLFEKWIDNSKYVAMCEGDDYWTDSYKLQKQVDFLEMHPEYTMCCHGVDWYQDGKFFKRNEISPTDVDLTIEDIISRGGFYFNICSVVLRKEYMQSQTRYQQIAEYGDWPLYVKLALAGKVRYLHEVMGVYRWMNNNSWTNVNYSTNQKLANHFYNTIEWLLALNEETKGTYKETIASVIASLIQVAYQYGAYPSKWKYLKDAKMAGKKTYIRAYKNIIHAYKNSLIKHMPHMYALFIKIRGKKKT